MRGALEPAIAYIEQRLPEHVRCVVGRRDPVMIAALACLLRWPDMGQALGYFQGFNIVGEFEPSGIFREVETEDLPEE